MRLECVEYCRVEDGCWKRGVGRGMISLLASCERSEGQEKHDDRLDKNAAPRVSKLDICLRARIYLVVLR